MFALNWVGMKVIRMYAVDVDVHCRLHDALDPEIQAKRSYVSNCWSLIKAIYVFGFWVLKNRS